MKLSKLASEIAESPTFALNEEALHAVERVARQGPPRGGSRTFGHRASRHAHLRRTPSGATPLSCHAPGGRQAAIAAPPAWRKATRPWVAFARIRKVSLPAEPLITSMSVAARAGAPSRVAMSDAPPVPLPSASCHSSPVDVL